MDPFEVFAYWDSRRTSPNWHWHWQSNYHIGPHRGTSDCIGVL